MVTIHITLHFNNAKIEVGLNSKKVATVNLAVKCQLMKAVDIWILLFGINQLKHACFTAMAQCQSLPVVYLFIA